jgi:hypothetical protein
MTAVAQEDFKPPSMNDKSNPSMKIQLPLLKDDERFVVKGFDGVTGETAQRIAIQNFGYFLRPAMVQVTSKDGRPLNVSIVKKHWKDIVREGVTNNGSLELSFKTAMEFGVMIDATETGIPFRVILSAGKEIIPDSNLFFDAKSFVQGGT